MQAMNKVHRRIYMDTILASNLMKIQDGKNT